MNLVIGAIKSKTVWFNIIGLAAVVLGSEQIKAFISPEHLTMAVFVVGLLLRTVTSTSLSAKA